MLDHANADTDEKDLERLFAEARKYPLLTAEQEAEIDGRKWQAVRELESLMIEDRAARLYLTQWAWHCDQTPPEVSVFRSRDLHFILRREVGDYLAKGKHAATTTAFRKSLGKKGQNQRERLIRLQELNLPASLVVGLVGVLLRRTGLEIQCSVADALQHGLANGRGRTHRGDDHAIAAPGGLEGRCERGCVAQKKEEQKYTD